MSQKIGIQILIIIYIWKLNHSLHFRSKDMFQLLSEQSESTQRTPREHSERTDSENTQKTLKTLERTSKEHSDLTKRTLREWMSVLAITGQDQNTHFTHSTCGLYLRIFPHYPWSLPLIPIPAYYLWSVPLITTTDTVVNISKYAEDGQADFNAERQLNDILNNMWSMITDHPVIGHYNFNFFCQKSSLPYYQH